MLLELFTCKFLKDPGCHLSVWNSVAISEPSSRMNVSILQDIVIKQTRRKEGHRKMEEQRDEDVKRENKRAKQRKGVGKEGERGNREEEKKVSRKSGGEGLEERGRWQNTGKGSREDGKGWGKEGCEGKRRTWG